LNRELGAAFDLLAAFDPRDGFFMERDGLGLATSGASVRIDVAAGEAQPARAAAAVTEELYRARATMPIAFGALPFEPTRPARFTIPRRVVFRREPGTTQEIGSGAKDMHEVAPPRGRDAPFAPFEDIQLKQEPSVDAYEDGVKAAVAMIHAGALDKVVLARTLDVDAGRPIDPVSLLRRLRAVDPSAFAFAVPDGDEGSLVGASPELLVSRSGRIVSANPLAGSAPRAGDPDQDRANAEGLSRADKDRREHSIVVEAVARTLEPFCDELVWDKEPALLATANVWHLSTRFRGVLRDPAPTALDLVAALHPTPAVCGEPTSTARAAIRELEPFDRGLYAGPVGWIDADGDGEWVLALRCALLRKDHATLCAGAGIVEGSDPSAEAAETEMKFRAFLDSLRWG
jgi:isochorismate synthase